MKWSKLKAFSESRLADSLHNRMFFYLTRYGERNSCTMARAWVTFDQQELLSFSEVLWLGKQQELASKIFCTLKVDIEFVGEMRSQLWFKAQADATALLEKQGLHSTRQFITALATFIDMPIDEAFFAENPLLRALAIIDRRIGKRRLTDFIVDENTPTVIRTLYTVRCKAEGIEANLDL